MRQNIGFAAAVWLRPPSKLPDDDVEGFKALAAQVRGWLKDPPKSWQRIDHLTYLEFPRPWHAYAHLRWTPPGQKTVTTGIGALHDLGLWGILERARKLRERLRGDGIDPREERRRRRRSITAASVWPDFRGVDYAATSPKQQAEYDRFWERDFSPVLGELDVAKVAVDDLVRALQPIYDRGTHGDRARALLTRFFAYLQARDLRPDNPAIGRLERLLPRHKKPVEHLPSLPWRDAPAFIGQLRGTPGVLARLDEVVILTGARSGEVRLARWSWIDRNARTLTVPAGFVKGRAEHRKPLPARVMEILHELASQREGNEDGLIFTRNGKPFADCELVRTVQACSERKVTLHGFRSTLRDWAASQTNFPREVCELVLGHSIKGEAERAYWRDDHLEKRRSLIEQWARFCAGPVVTEGGDVVPLRAAG